MMRTLLSLILALFVLAAAQAQTAENLLAVTYDGLRWQELFGGLDERLVSPKAMPGGQMDVMRERYGADTPEARREILLPFFWGTIAKEGQVYGDAERGSVSTVTNGRNFSYPGYNELLTGAPDDAIDSNAKEDNRNVSVLEWLNNREAFAGKVAAFTSWDVFPYILNANRSGLPVNAGWSPLTEGPDPDRLAFINGLQAETPHYWAGVRFDAFTFHAAAEHIRAHQPRVIYVAFGETDDWAHDGRYDLYLEAARRTDAYIERLWKLLQSMPQYAGKTALLMSTDHGRGDTIDDWTGHGSNVLGCERIWIALYGAGVPTKGLVENVETTQSQVAATAAALLGMDFTAANAKVAEAISY